MTTTREFSGSVVGAAAITLAWACGYWITRGVTGPIANFELVAVLNGWWFATCASWMFDIELRAAFLSGIGYLLYGTLRLGLGRFDFGHDLRGDTVAAMFILVGRSMFFVTPALVARVTSMVRLVHHRNHDAKTNSFLGLK